MSDSSSCNLRLSWLMKSCLPNANNPHQFHHPQPISTTFLYHRHNNISSLPDDLLLECLTRVPSSSLPSLSLVCRRWFHLLQSSSFPLLRRHHGLLHHTLFAISSVSHFALHTASLRIYDPYTWQINPPFTQNDAGLHSLLSAARLVSIGRMIFIIGRSSMVRFDTWTHTILSRSPMKFARKRFAATIVAGKIYVAGGCSRTSAMEEYDPESDTWRVVTHAPRKRYGCIGASADGVFYVIGGLKIGASGTEAHMYPSSMDLFDVGSGNWLKIRAVPGGGCVVGACAVGGDVYVLASHAVELSFWKFQARRERNSGGFGEWCRIKGPPLPAQVRLDNTVRFSCVGVGEKVALIQVMGCIDDLLRRGGRSERGLREGLVLVYDCVGGEWSRAADLPDVIQRPICVSVEC